mmetsp:Transcript_8689/g.16702  ORF Transcript_8689/g.16702 Transcript_8689/m.16702 type:complete len:183 (-) Transcript_8689:32-580(-)|eukprot:scaffold34623_cov274-Amphora_coffeaeformis.AAC.1
MTTPTSTNNNSKGILETIDDQLHATILPLEGKDYEAWKEKHYPEEPPETKKGVLTSAKEQIGSLFTKTKEEPPKQEPTKAVTEQAKELTEQAQQMAGEAKDQLVKVGDKVDDQLHAVTLPLEGKDYDDWKQAKEEQRQKDNKPEEREFFLDKATTKVKGLFTSGYDNNSNNKEDSSSAQVGQ